MKPKWIVELTWGNSEKGLTFKTKKEFVILPKGKHIAMAGAEAIAQNRFLEDFVITKFDMYEVK